MNLFDIWNIYFNIILCHKQCNYCLCLCKCNTYTFYVLALGYLDWVMHIAHIVWKVVKVLRNEPHRISIFLRCFSRQSRMQGVDGLLPGASSTSVKMYTKTCNHVHFCHYFERKNLTFTNYAMCCTHHKYLHEDEAFIKSSLAEGKKWKRDWIENWFWHLKLEFLF